MTNLPDIWRTSFAKEFDRLFDHWASPSLRRTEADLSRYGFNPSCEVSEDSAAYHLKFDLPGVPKDQIKIDLHEGRLTVSGERRAEKSEENKKQHFSEVFYGSFSRSMVFPTAVNAEKVTATYENGILNISVPKVESAKSRQITIK